MVFELGLRVVSSIRNSRDLLEGGWLASKLPCMHACMHPPWAWIATACCQVPLPGFIIHQLPHACKQASPLGLDRYSLYQSADSRPVSSVPVSYGQVATALDRSPSMTAAARSAVFFYVHVFENPSMVA